MTTTNVVVDGAEAAAGTEALQKLKSTDLPLYLSPSPDLSKAARIASQYLFSSLKPYTPKSSFDRLLVEDFDAEQIWQQIDIQSQPLISSVRRQVRNFDKNPEKIKKLFNLTESKDNDGDDVKEEENRETLDLQREVEDEELEGFDDEDEDEDEDEDDEEEEGEGTGEGVEDKFLKIKELEEFLEEDEAKEYGLKRNKKGKSSNEGKIADEDSDEEEDEEEGEEGEEDDDEEEDQDLGLMGLEDDDDEDGEGLGNARYKEFFGGKRNAQKRKVNSLYGSDDEEMNDDEDQKKKKLSSHEKELAKIRSTIEEMEKANLEPKTWTMRGEVTAAKRPKNSALEVDLDFEHNARPAPVITEEVTASLEELIKKRILEGRFDNVQKPPKLPSKVQREAKELDDNKSKKGLAEVYEEEYVQKTGLVSKALSLADEKKKEAKLLFKELCSKLDALSHFHFTPKPVIEDMSIQTNVPALAMEEIAPLAVSDAAMLAPEEVFAGKGDIKEETELTQAERKRRRAKKKRKFKAESARRMAIDTQKGTQPKRGGGDENEES